MPLNASVEHIIFQIQDDPTLRWPEKMKSASSRRNLSRYCHFHRDHGHDTDDCFDLKRQIEELIQRGQLRQYVAGRGQVPPPSRDQDDRERQRPLGEIQTIA